MFLKKLIVVLLTVVCTSSIVFADNLFGTTNPFVGQTNPQQFNNIYETEPSSTVKEQAEKKKMRFWKKNTANTKNKDEYSVNEGIINDGSFYVFPPRD